MEAIGVECLGFCHLGIGYVDKREVMIMSPVFFRHAEVKIVQGQA